MKKPTIILSFLALIFNVLSAQDTTYSEEHKNITQTTNPRITHPLGLTFNIGGPATALSASIDYFVHPNVSIAAGAGIYAFYGGAEYHVLGGADNQSWTPYSGLYFVRVPEFEILFNTIPKHNKLYIPLGVQYIGDKGFTFATEIGVMTTYTGYGSPVRPWITIKLGAHSRLQ